MQSSILQNPLYCNTGVQSYIVPQFELSYSIDWLRFTTGKIKYGIDGEPTNSSIPIINKLLKLMKCNHTYHELDLVPKGLFGYRSSMVVSEGITLHFNGPINKHGEKTTMVEISGAGCDHFETLHDWFEFMSFILSDEFDCRASRFDEAVDDFTGKNITGAMVFNILRRGFFKRSGSPKSKIQWVTSNLDSYGDGTTAYLYSNTSSIQFCIYDKMAEVKAKKNKETNTSQWMRYEMRFYDDKAHEQLLAFYNCLLREKFNLDSYLSVPKLISSSMYELLRLYIPTNDSNKSRWEELPEWLNFVGDVKNIKFERNKSHRSNILKTKEYFEENYAKFLLKIYLTFGLDYLYLWIRDLMFKKRGSLESKDIVSINDLRISLDEKKLSKTDLFVEISKLKVTDKEELEILNIHDLSVKENYDMEEKFNKFISSVSENDNFR